MIKPTNVYEDIDIGRSVYHFFAIYIHSNEIHKKKLLRMDRYGPKHVELTPEC